MNPKSPNFPNTFSPRNVCSQGLTPQGWREKNRPNTAEVERSDSGQGSFFLGMPGVPKGDGREKGRFRNFLWQVAAIA